VLRWSKVGRVVPWKARAWQRCNGEAESCCDTGRHGKGDEQGPGLTGSHLRYAVADTNHVNNVSSPPNRRTHLRAEAI
jgi:hypothetical protein